MPKYLVHKAVPLDKVKAKRRAQLQEVGYLDRHYLAQPKYDGCCGIVVDGVMLSRTGEMVHSCDHIVEAIVNDFNDMVVFGEVWHRELPQSEISGKFRQHDAAPELKFVVFDVISRMDYERGNCTTPYFQRLQCVYNQHKPLTDDDGCVSAFSAAVWRPAVTYFQGSYGFHEDFLQSWLKPGYDGIILRDGLAPWIQGTGTGGEIIKVKRSLHFDLLVLGVNEGAGKMAGMAGTLTLQWDGGRTIEAGGMDYATRTEWLQNPQSIIGMIVEVEAMDYTKEGLLREPRIKSIRYDKENPDF